MLAEGRCPEAGPIESLFTDQQETPAFWLGFFRYIFSTQSSQQPQLGDLYTTPLAAIAEALIRPTVATSSCKRFIIAPCYFLSDFILKKRSRLALVTTVIEDNAIAPPAITGLSNMPVKG